MAPRIAMAALAGAQEGQRLPIPRHGSYRGLGVGGFHRLHYCDWGSPDNPRVVVCVHGYSRHARDFDVLARALSTDFRVICPDLAPRGQRDWLGTATDYGSAQMLADLNALLSRLDVDEVDWIGTSLGASLGSYLRAQPGSPIRRLVEIPGRGNAPLRMSPTEIEVVRRSLGAQGRVSGVDALGVQPA